MTDPDWPIRHAALESLGRLVALHGSELNWDLITRGFDYRGERILFANRARGIFKPKEMKGAALSIKTTVPKTGRVARYDDLVSNDAFHYRFQGEDPNSHDNRALRLAHELQTPLIYFYGIAPGIYAPIWPVFVSHFDAQALTCTVVTGEGAILEPGTFAADGKVLAIERRYATVETKKRLHQQAFRAQVLEAYAERCAICSLPRRELLEASHILPDRDARGIAEVPNGLALCRLHHGAFDANLLGIRPTGVVEISTLLMNETDGPVLEQGLKAYDAKPLRLPSVADLRPRKDYLEERYELFRAKSA